MPASTEELVELLSLEEIDRNLFRGRQPDTHLQRVFGGQVAAQALIAACRTVDPKYHAHSLHSYFLLPGDTAVPIVYDVEQLRDGRSFATRRVVARQHGRAIFFLTASFQVEEGGFEHQDAMPETVPPEHGVPLTDLVRARGEAEGDAFAREWAALDVRYVGIPGKGLPEDPDHPARARLWIRVNGELSDDPLEHLAAFTYASDLTLLGAALVPHGVTIGTPGLQPASLDHAMWFHQAFRADEWWLYDQYAPAAQGARGLAMARVFTQDGRLVASVAQEGLIRMHATD
ncbi:acyl-CoA thioesterase [Nocardioides euryhalodurans]|uniref:Acyl-CoA thioesterase 2 n=1 Tax=Nocardioides euryhalodurans TaxID=2518370 RepID=A0A4P7GGX8_9ACTN|nr:acyl-CoA thioesterase II [Nocardioides euryhalodurans]QBR91003.1 acyl-CoA thioesterase II [Nocardioides euryhalodurans]